MLIAGASGVHSGQTEVDYGDFYPMHGIVHHESIFEPVSCGCRFNISDEDLTPM